MFDNMAVSEDLEALEQRLNDLELRVFGAADKDAVYPKCIDSLGEVQSRLSAAVAGKKKIQQLYERLPELKQYMDPILADDMTISESGKVTIILLVEDFIRKQAKMLELTKMMEDITSSEHLRGVPAQVPKLQTLSQVQLEQQDQTAALSEEVQHMLNTYNSIITLLSKQFVYWDQLVAKMEAQP